MSEEHRRRDSRMHDSPSAFLSFYLGNHPLPIDLGRHGKITDIKPSAAGARLDLEVLSMDGSHITIELQRKAAAKHSQVSTSFLDLRLRSKDCRADGQAWGVVRAFSRYFRQVETKRGQPPIDTFFISNGSSTSSMDPARRHHRLELILFPTDACNLRCTYCIVPFGKEKLSTAQIDKVFQVSRKSDLDRMGVTFLGGEPMLRWDSIVDVTKRMANWWEKPSLAMVTNGTLVNQERAAFIGKHKFGITFSVDGLEDAHSIERLPKDSRDQAVARKLFQRTITGLKMTQGTGAEVKVNMVVTPKTVDKLVDGVRFLTDLGVELLTISPSVGVEWGEEGLSTLRFQLEAYAELLLGQIQTMSEAKRIRTRRVLRWEIRRCWYFMGQDVFNPHTRRVVVGPDGRLFSDLYNDETEALLYLGQLGDIEKWTDLPQRYTTVPQAMYRARPWSADVIKDVLGLSRTLFDVLTALDAEAFSDESVDAELMSIMPMLDDFVPVPEDTERDNTTSTPP
jgi:sulfatase maturation enzyme AslB (radical SAM superfamily)